MAQLGFILETVKSWSADDLEELLEVARAIETRRPGRYALSQPELEAVAEGLAQARRGEFVNDREMDELWSRSGL